MRMPPDDLIASAECRSFLTLALCTTAADRGTARQLLEHAWLVRAADTAGTCSALKEWLDENTDAKDKPMPSVDFVANSIGLLSVGTDDS